MVNFEQIKLKIAEDAGRFAALAKVNFDDDASVGNGQNEAIRLQIEIPKDEVRRSRLCILENREKIHLKQLASLRKKVGALRRKIQKQDKDISLNRGLLNQLHGKRGRSLMEMNDRE